MRGHHRPRSVRGPRPAGRRRAVASVRRLCPGRFPIGGKGGTVASMPDISLTPRTRTRIRTARPKLYKVMLVNDDFTPREFVVLVLKSEFGMTEDQAYKVMVTAHQR